MALLSERQQRARAIADELSRMTGVWIVSPLPLDDGAKFRLQILDSARNRVLQAIKDWGHEPRFVSMLPRMTYEGAILAEVYEFDPLPQERQQPIVNDGTIYGELAKPQKTDAEREAMRRYLGLDYKEKKSR